MIPTWSLISYKMFLLAISESHETFKFAYLIAKEIIFAIQEADAEYVGKCYVN